MIKQTIYDAYTKVTPSEKGAIIRFLTHNLEDQPINKDQIGVAVDHAVKEIPSFGGFILTMSKEEEILAVVIVNNTGMDGFAPGAIVSYFATHNEHRNVGIGRKILQNAVRQSKKDLSIHLAAKHPEKALFSELGFKETQVEMQLRKTKNKVPVSTSKIA